MKAVYYENYQSDITINTVPDPTPTPDGIVIKVEATGLCRSDWHGWMGHDPDISLPHVPGHELAGIVVAVGKDVTRFKGGERVTVPFVGGCGNCGECHSGNQQVCVRQFQPGFTHWGSFAEYVAINYADLNVVDLPEEIDFVTAASLGCRFVTSFRGVVDQGKVSAGQWVAVHGCGGVGLSAIMIAKSLGANVLAVDIKEDKLEFAKSIGADLTLNALDTPRVSSAVKKLTKGGVHVSVDALGSATTCFNSVANLRRRGKHIQIGLLLGDELHPPIPMERVIAHELEIYGSHGMQAHRYPAMLQMIKSGQLEPQKLIGDTIGLDEVPEALANMDSFQGVGVTVITPNA